jgi:hypothetical protein
VFEGLRLLLLFVFENRFKSSVCKTKSLYTIEESLKELKLRFNYYDRFIKVDYKVNLLKLLCIVSKLVSDEFFLDLLYKYLRLCSLNSKAEYLVKTDEIIYILFSIQLNLVDSWIEDSLLPRYNGSKFDIFDFNSYQNNKLIASVLTKYSALEFKEHNLKYL